MALAAPPSPTATGAALRLRARTTRRISGARERDRLTAVWVYPVVHLSIPQLLEVRCESRALEHVQRVAAHREDSSGVHHMMIVQSKRVWGCGYRTLVNDSLPVVFAVPLKLRQLE